MAWWTALLNVWWVWICLALVLGVIELLAPATIFLGFALAALAMAAVVALVSGLSAPALLALYGFLSLVAWMVLRRAFKRQTSDVRIVTKDINDN